MKALTCKCLFIIMLISILLSACTKERDKVRLLTEKQAIGIANRKYGDAEFTKDADKSEYSIIYYLRDSECGFDYTLKTFVDTVSIDGSVLGYEEDHVSNFDIEYKKFLLKEVIKGDNDFCLLKEDVDAENEFVPFSNKEDNIVLVYKENGATAYFSLYIDNRSFNISETFVYCYSSDKAVALNGSEKLSKIINQLDARKYFLSEKIPIHLITSKSSVDNEYNIDYIETVLLKTD